MCAIKSHPLLPISLAKIARHRSITMLAAMLCITPFGAVDAQATSRTVRACTVGALQNCAQLRFATSPGSAPGLTQFELLVTNLGSVIDPLLATTIYNFVFITGLSPAVPVSVLVTPAAMGGATMTDPSDWDLFDPGDAIFLSALTNNGVGNCVVAPSQGGFGQAGNTCGVGQVFRFGYETPNVFDIAQFSIANMEIVALDAALTGDSCGDPSRPCFVTDIPSTTTPEPATLLFLATGLIAVGATVGRRRATVFVFAMKARLRDVPEGADTQNFNHGLRQKACGLAILAVLLLNACVDPERPVAAHGAAPSISLAANAGTATFAWLLPLGSGAPDPATFDAAAAPIVEICPWNGATCNGPVIARFAISATPPDLTLTVNPNVGQYEGVWSLLSATFTTRKTYRIRVVQGATEIGAVSVDVVRGRWGLTKAGSLAPLTSATTLPIRFFVAHSGPPVVQDVIDANGGTLTLPNIARITFAPGAFTNSVTVELADEVMATPPTFLDDAPLYEAQSRSTHEIRIRYADTEPPQATVAADIAIPPDIQNRVPIGGNLQVFVRVFSGGGEATFRYFPLITQSNSASGLHVLVPDIAFVSEPAAAGLLTARLVMGTTTGIPGVTATAPSGTLPPGASPTRESAFTAANLRATLLPSCTAQSPSGNILAPLTVWRDITANRNANGDRIGAWGYYRPPRTPGPNGYYYHAGADISAPVGTSVYAAQEGQADVSNMRGYGLVVVLHHTAGGVTLYGHLSGVAPALTSGSAHVQKGDLLGYTGLSGRTSSNDPHLHLEYHSANNPFTIVNSKGLLSYTIDPFACQQYPVLSVADNPTLVSVSGPAVPVIATASDQEGTAISGLTFMWSSLNAAIATIATGGNSALASVSGVSGGNTQIRTSAAGTFAMASVGVTPSGCTGQINPSCPPPPPTAVPLPNGARRVTVNWDFYGPGWAYTYCEWIVFTDPGTSKQILQYATPAPCGFYDQPTNTRVQAILDVPPIPGAGSYLAQYRVWANGFPWSSQLVYF